MNRVLNWSPIVLGLLFTVVLMIPLRERALSGQNDFVSFYTGGQMAGTPELYTREANIEAIQRVLGITMEGTAFVRAPYYAVLLRPFSWFPYMTAYALFSLTTLLSVLWFVVRFSKESTALPFFASMGFPLAASIALGQDTAYLLVIFSAFILLLRQGKDFWAGVVLAMCLMKFHLFLFVPLALLLKKRWRVLGGGVTGFAGLMTLGLAVGGVESVVAWVKVMRDPWVTPDPYSMPNLHRIALGLQGGLPVDILLLAILGGLFFWIARKTDNQDLLLGICLVCGLLANVHCFLADEVLLFPAFVLITGASTNVALRSLAALVVTPIPHIVSFLSSSYAMVLPVMLLALVVAAAIAVSRKTALAAIAPAFAVGPVARPDFVNQQSNE